MNEVKTAPFPTKDLHNIFNNRPHVTIDLKNSKFQGEGLISYITNMKLSWSLLIDPDLSYEDKETLLKAFMKYKYSTDCDTLLGACATVLLHSRGYNLAYNEWLSKEDIDKYIANNKELIQMYSDFLDSMLVALPMASVELKPAFEAAIESGEIELMERVTEDDKLEVVGINEIGANTLGLLTIPDFLEMFIAANDNIKLRYFRYQTENLFYKQKSLYDILVGDSINPSMAFLNVLLANDEEEVAVKEKYFLKGA